MEKLNATVFLKTVETGSFKKTADALGYTQAGISYIINAMEDEFGLLLFEREYGGVKLTSEGRELLPLIKQIADREHYLQEAINDIRNLNSGTVRVSTFYSVSIFWLPGMIRKFKDAHPGINVEVVNCDVDRDNERLIYDREVDCGFLSDDPAINIETYDLMEESFLIAVPTDHPTAKNKKFPIAEVGNYPYINMTYDRPSSDIYEKVFMNRAAPKPAYTVDNDFAAMAMVSQGLGISIFPQLLLKDVPFPVKCLEFDKPFKRTIRIGSRSLSDCSHATKRFIQCAREWVNENDFSVSK